MAQITPPKSEIDDAFNAAQEQVDAGGTKVPGMSYEDGVVATILWLTGQSDENPMDD